MITITNIKARQTRKPFSTIDLWIMSTTQISRYNFLVAYSLPKDNKFIVDVCLSPWNAWDKRKKSIFREQRNKGELENKFPRKRKSIQQSNKLPKNHQIYVKKYKQTHIETTTLNIHNAENKTKDEQTKYHILTLGGGWGWRWTCNMKGKEKPSKGVVC